MRRIYLALELTVFVIVCISIVFFFKFTAEDAYITYRYSENLVNIGSLVYNVGEPINAMTSPLHALLSSFFYFVTRDTVLSNKIFSLVLMLIAVALVWKRYRGQLPFQVMALILLTPPSVLLWTFGGLETPILLFLATLTTILAIRPGQFSVRSLYMIFFLAGLAFLTRYDSVLFFLPVLLYAALRSGSLKHVMLAAVIAAVLPLIWLYISVSYYGDLLPTSFYVKTPKGHLGDLFFNGLYISSYLLYVGIIPVVGFAVAVLLSGRKFKEVVSQHFKSVWWLYVGILVELLYGLTMATHHMMFSFRFFVPYIPSAVILVVDLLRRSYEARDLDLTVGRPAYLFTGVLLILALFQLYQIGYTYNRSVNGLSLVGEYRALGIRDYVSFMQILKQEALDIEHHWDGISAGMDRRPRVITYAAGILPYTYRDAYIYEKLVSYRHCYQRHQQALYADYIHILAPRQGEIADQLPLSEDSYVLVSSYDMFFDGSMQKFLVYYNPQPEEHNLSAGISDACTDNRDQQQQD